MSTPMPNFDFIIDLHCHPTYKPVGASYKSNKGIQDPSPSKRASIWNYDSPGLVDKLINEFAGLTKFSQSNFSAATYGQVFIITVALGSIEKWFLNNDLGTGNVADVLENFLLEIGKQRINSIQNTTDYFIDLKEEMDFLAQMDGKQVKIDGKPFLYKVVSNFNDLNAAMVQNETALNQIQGSGNDLPLTIAVIPSIEGMHVLNCGLIDSQTKIGEPPNVNEVLENAGRLKQLKYKPFFVTFTHHFYNQLCGHSKSLNETVARFCRQENGMGQSFTETGKKVLDILLDNTNNDRILVDIKHLSPQGRKEFFTLRNTKYQDVPIIVSHGAANGMPSFGASVSNFPEPIGKTLLAEEINFYDDEILLIEESKGIFGLQLDERRIANKETLKHIYH